MNDKENLSTIEKNGEEDGSLNNDIKSMKSEELKSSENEERVSSHGIPARENAESGVEHLEINFDRQ